MKVISAASSKGGAGKSSLVIGIASYLHWKKKKTMILDLDPQGSVALWLSNQFEDIDPIDPDLLSVEALVPDGNDETKIRVIANRLGELAESGDYDYLLIDTKGEQAKITSAIGAYSDFVLCPTNGHAIEFEPVVKTYMNLSTVIKELGLPTDPDKLFSVILSKRKVVESGEVRSSQKMLAERFNVIAGPTESASYNQAIQFGTTIDRLLSTVQSIRDTSEVAKLRANAKRACERHEKSLETLDFMMTQLLNGEEL